MKYIEDIRDWLIAQGLDADYKVQPYEWKDSTITTDRFIVIHCDGKSIESIHSEILKKLEAKGLL